MNPEINDGKCLKLKGIVQDVTDEIELKAQLGECLSELNDFKNAVDNSVSYIILDQKGKVIETNEKADKLFEPSIGNLWNVDLFDHPEIKKYNNIKTRWDEISSSEYSEEKLKIKTDHNRIVELKLTISPFLKVSSHYTKYIVVCYPNYIKSPKIFGRFRKTEDQRYVLQ